LLQIDVIFANHYTLTESVQAHSTPVVNLVASHPLDSVGSNVLGCRQRLVSAGEDGEVRVWAIQLEDDASSADKELRPITLQLLFHVGSYFNFSQYRAPICLQLHICLSTFRQQLSSQCVSCWDDWIS